ncbi:MAG: phosphoglycerate kinase [Rickettsiales bacterium]
MKEFYSVRDFDVSGKTVILRTDFNVPIIKGKITDESRIERSMATIKYLINNKAKIIVLSHFDRPQGKFNPDMSLAPIVDSVSSLLGNKQVHFAYDIMSSAAEKQVHKLTPGEILIAENIRFHPEEESNSKEFAKKLAGLADFYINDAFSCSHRAHASIEAITEFLPSAAGLLHEEEINSLNKYIDYSKKIFAITGGAKVSSKIDLLSNLIKKASYLVIGGAMANTFLKANGLNVGKSLYEEDQISTAKKILNEATKNNCQIILPSDVVTAKNKKSGRHKSRVVDSNKVSSNEMILDIGPQTITDIIEKMLNAKIVIWNGPLGAFEYRPFDIGTTTISRAIAKYTKQKKIISVAGGGDVVSAIHQSGLEDNFSYISTGGGAFLEWLSSTKMPGIIALKKNYEKNHISD